MMSALHRESLSQRRLRQPLRVEIPPLEHQDEYEYWESNEELSRPEQGAATSIETTSFVSLSRARAFSSLRIMATIIKEILKILSVLLSKFWLICGRFVIVSVMFGALVSIEKVGDIAIGVINSHYPPPITERHINFTDAIPLATQIDRRLNVTYFRLLVKKDTPERTIKYASVRFDVESLAVRQSAQSQIGVVQIPRLPEGTWNTVEFGLSPDNKKVEVVSTSLIALPRPRMRIVWHPDSYRFIDLEIRPMPRSTERLKLVYHPALQTRGNLAVMKYAPFAQQVAGIENESKTYHRISATSLAPKFLGHVTDPDGRVIGFLIEYIWDARPAKRKNSNSNNNDTSDDDSRSFSDLAVAKCRETLGTLHSLRVAHNTPRTGDCLIRNDGSAVLINFEHAVLNGIYRGWREYIGAYERDLARMKQPVLKKSKILF